MNTLATPLGLHLRSFSEPVDADPNQLRQVVIIGGGPAAYTAAIYAARAGLRPLVIEGFLWGGQPMQATEIENFPGFPFGVQGPELSTNMRTQAAMLGAEFVSDEATAVKLEGAVKTVWVGETFYKARTVIVATGAIPRRLGVEGEQRLIGRGISYCVNCDAAFFRAKKVVVAVSGNNDAVALEEALHCSRFAEHVTVSHTGVELSAPEKLIERVRHQTKIELLMGRVIRQINGDLKLESVIVEQASTGEMSTIDCEGLFVAIGHRPNTEIFRGELRIDRQGYLVTDRVGTRAANIAGVYVAGDVADSIYRQAVTAAATGCMAALDVQHDIDAGVLDDAYRSIHYEL